MALLAISSAILRVDLLVRAKRLVPARRLRLARIAEQRSQRARSVPSPFQTNHPWNLAAWSDRAFFLAFRALFGLQGLPYHIWIFLTQFANLALMSHTTWRLTGSRLAGFCAPLFWIGNAALVMAMSLACLYKDILCSFFLLLAFYFFLRYIETGARHYYVWQWVVFLLGFAMETNLV